MKNITKQIFDVVCNHEKYSVQLSVDWNLIAIGNLQIENLDWRWIPNDMSIETVLLHDPYWWRFNRNLKEGFFQTIKYGLSGKNTIKQYVPLYKFGIPYEQQLSILEKEMKKMMQNGPRTCETGIEIIPEQTSLWRSINSLAKNCRGAFVSQQNRIIEHNNKQLIKYDDEELFKSGAKITPKILDNLEDLYQQLIR